jgi:hypothetical protein
MSVQVSLKALAIGALVTLGLGGFLGFASGYFVHSAKAHIEGSDMRETQARVAVVEEKTKNLPFRLAERAINALEACTTEKGTLHEALMVYQETYGVDAPKVAQGGP